MRTVPHTCPWDFGNIDVIVAAGSDSDFPECMSYAAGLLKDTLGLNTVSVVCSAHRTPERVPYLIQLAEAAEVKVIIAAAGGAAHLPGMLAAHTFTIPIIGVPVQSKALGGVDSLLSIVQMPPGVPVATMAIGKPGAINAAVYAATLIGMSNATVREAVVRYREGVASGVPMHP